MRSEHRVNLAQPRNVRSPIPRYSRTEIVMGMPITVVSADEVGDAADAVFAHLRAVDARFSPFKNGSEVERMNRGEIAESEYSEEMRRVLRLCENTKCETNGYFDAWRDGRLDPSGLVKGLALHDAAEILTRRGIKNFCIDGGGDIEVRGRNAGGRRWRIGIRNPFDPYTTVKTLALEDRGVATSGLYIRGEHIYNPRSGRAANEIASLTVVGSNVYEADRLATAAFAMGKRGLDLIAGFRGFDAYLVEHDGTATFTDGFLRYVTI